MRLILICTGNTCRSPLAEVLLRARLLDHPQLNHLEVSSAGTAARNGSPASDGSYLIALERGLDLSGHRARVVTPSLIEEATLILTMGRSHAVDIAAMGGATKVQTLAHYAGADSGDVPDPFGGDVETYRHTAEMIDTMLALAVERLEREAGS